MWLSFFFSSKSIITVIITIILTLKALKISLEGMMKMVVNQLGSGFLTCTFTIPSLEARVILRGNIVSVGPCRVNLPQYKHVFCFYSEEISEKGKKYLEYFSLQKPLVVYMAKVMF
jgi:hypothetical protein